MQNFQLIRSARRTLSLEVHPEGEVIVRAPRRLSESEIRAFVESKADWIAKKLRLAHARKAEAPSRQFRPGEFFLYQGESFPLHISVRPKPALLLEEAGFSLSNRSLPSAARTFTDWYRAQARSLFALRIAHHSQQTGLRYARLRLSSATTRWGSWSATGTISLNWKLIMAPPSVLDYVILHELCHTRHRNHSPSFWGLLETLMPDWRRHRKWLRENGHRLTVT